MANFVWWGNARVTAWMHYRLSQLHADLIRLFGVGLVANSGIRLEQEQLDLWYARYTRTPNGRKVYDTRWWNGQLWYRISNLGTVAQPKTSNHEIQGDTAAVDIADTGSDAGITSRNSTRGRWIRANAAAYDLVAEGDSFGEGWHFKVLGIFRTPPTTPAVPKNEELPVNIQLVLYVPTNDLLLVDHMSRTIRNMGHSSSDPARAYLATKPWGKAYDRGSVKPDGVSWQDLIKAGTEDEYKYL